MARPPSTPGGRPHQITVRFSDAELANIDAARGGLKRPTYLRHLAANHQTSVPLKPQPTTVEPVSTDDDIPYSEQHQFGGGTCRYCGTKASNLSRRSRCRARIKDT